jgi:predicted transcriptional regulator
MAAILNHPEDPTITERAVMDILQREGTQTIESLVRHAGLEWTQVFGAIDSLSRSGVVRLWRVQGGHYQVSLNGSPT